MIIIKIMKYKMYNKDKKTAHNLEKATISILVDISFSRFRRIHIYNIGI